MPVRLICSVRGMGVADRLTTSTWSLSLPQQLLLAHAEALLLVDDDQAEVARRDVAGEHPVGAYQHVHFAFAKFGQDAPLLRRRAKARDHLHVDRQFLEALGERSGSAARRG